MTPADISVVIPAINEEASLAQSIQSAQIAGAGEITVVDGGSTDSTLRVAQQAGATKVVSSDPGRGIQLNAGAAVTERSIVLFLHADNRLTENCLSQIAELDHVTWGAFRQQIDSHRLVFRAIEFGNWARARYRHVPFGDQAIFVRRDLFDQDGGFADVPLMEDVDLSKRLRRVSKPAILDGPVIISARRWEAFGVVRQTLRNWSIQWAYARGASPEELAKRYR